MRGVLNSCIERAVSFLGYRNQLLKDSDKTGLK